MHRADYKAILAMQEILITSGLDFPHSPDIPSPSPRSSHQCEREHNSLIISSHFLPPKYKNQLMLQLKQIAVWGQRETCGLFLAMHSHWGSAGPPPKSRRGRSSRRCWAERGCGCCLSPVPERLRAALMSAPSALLCVESCSL